MLCAEQRLREMVHDACTRGNSPLPSLSRLAGRLGVARATVRKAIQRLQREGLIVSSLHRGYTATGAQSSPSPPRPPAAPHTPPRPHYSPVPRWRTVACALKRDILEGRFPAGSQLPSAKELRARYGCGHPSLQEAIRSLCEEDRLRRHSRHYKVSGATPATPSATLVFASLGTNPSRFSTLTPHSPELWRHLETECHRRRLSLAVRRFEDVAADPWVKGSTVLGYIVSTLPSGIPALREPAIRAALSTHLPVVLLDESGDGAQLVRTHASPLLRCFALATAGECGRMVGDYLVARGHRRVAFIAPQDATMERRRWAGVCRPFEQIGQGGAVSFRAIGAPTSHTIVDDPAVLAFRDRVADAARDFARSKRSMPVVLTELFPPRFATFAASIVARGRIHPACTELLRTESATAWVAFNDEIALLLLGELGRAGVRAPHDLSLVGFDDTLEGFGAGLTSYSFNIPAIVNAMLEHILAPRPRGASTSVVEIPGMVLERRTSGIVDAGLGVVDCRMPKWNS